jgi:hypothetical protein
VELIVTLKKLARQLRREASRNPKKALVLGLLVVAAVYYWTPLVRRWLSEDDLPPTQAVDGLAAGSLARPVDDVTADGPDPRVSGQVKTPSWDKVICWMEQDPTTTPVADLGKDRDPFWVAERKPAELEGGESEAEQRPGPAAPAVTPEELGIQLSATVVGPRRRVAMIDGEAYSEGRRIVRTKDGRQFEFTLLEILPRHVVLEREDNRFLLEIPRRQWTRQIELVRNPE